MDLQNDIVYPSIIFKLKGVLYAVGSQYASSISQLPAFQAVPEMPREFVGIFTHRGQVVPLLGMRTLLGMTSLRQEFADFTDMLAAREQDHIRWVAELERSTAAGEEFTLATDPHKCAFGKWYYSYKPDNLAVAFELNKIEEPHKLLHHAAFEVTECEQNHDSCTRDECIKHKFARLKENYMPKIIRILEDTRAAYLASYREMVIVLEGSGGLVGIVVDEVLAVEELSDTDEGGALQMFGHQRYITGVKKSETQNALVLLLDDEKLLALTVRDRATA